VLSEQLDDSIKVKFTQKHTDNITKNQKDGRREGKGNLIYDYLSRFTVSYALMISRKNIN